MLPTTNHIEPKNIRQNYLRSYEIDIEKFTEDELIDLNNRIVARLKFIQQFRAHAKMLEFSIGDRVSFQPEGHPELTGMLTRYNKKTALCGL